MAELTNEYVHLVPKSKFEALHTHRESLMEALSDLDAIKEESESVTLQLAMAGPLKRIGDAVTALIEVTRKE